MDVQVIPLRARDGSVRVYAIVDAADADFVNQWRWSLSSEGYAYRNGAEIGGRRRQYKLHRELLGLAYGDGFDGDHIDLDRLNNRRNNLRVLPKGANQQNHSSHQGSSSLYRGVSWHKASASWTARVKVAGKNYHLGCFTNEHEAARASSEARARLMPYSSDALIRGGDSAP